nr:reverse transcriptase domain-containing protein [Tanacetum cinerariifolium]
MLLNCFTLTHSSAPLSSSKLSRDQTSNPTSSTNPTPKGRIRRSSKQKVENSNFEENLPPEVPMADNRTMAQLLQAPTEGYEDAIVIPEITATNFEFKHGLINLVQNKQFFGHDKEDPLAHIRYFNKITSTMRVPNDSLNSAEGGNFLDKMPSDCLKIIESKSKFRQARAKAVVAKVNLSSSTPAISFDIAELKDMVRALLLDKKNQYSAPSTTPALIKAVEPNCVTCGANYGQGNTSFRPRPDNLPSEKARTNIIDRDKQFYLFPSHRGGNFNQSNFNQGQLHRPQVNQPLAYQAPTYQAHVPQTQSVSQTEFERYVKANDAILRNIQSQGQSMQNQCQTMQNQFQTMQNQLANLTDMMSKFISSNTASSSGSGTLPGNTITNPKEDLKGITIRSGVSYQGPTIPTPSKVAKQGTEVTKDQVQTLSLQSTAPVHPPVVHSESKTLVSEPAVAPVSASMPNLKSSIPYPLRRDNERRRDQDNKQIKKFYEIFKDMSFEISFTDALILMPKFSSTLKALIGNKEKLSEMDITSMNEHCSAVILNKLPKKLGDPDKFLIPCEFSGMDECLALADLGASINLMLFSVWKGLSLLELTLTCMTLKLADRMLSKLIGISKYVSVKVGVFHFPADFVVVDFEPDPRVLLILGRCFLKTGRALIDVYKGELTLRIENEAITYNLDQTSRYSTNYDQITANKIDVTDEACEEYSQEVLDFSDVIASGSLTPSDDPIVSTTSPTLTPFGDNPSYYDPKEDILLLEAILNSKPSPPLPNHEQSVPSFKEELKACKAKMIKSSVDEPPEVELKDLPSHLEYVFLEGDNKLPIIIAKELGDEEKSALIKVLKSHKRAIASKLSDIEGIESEFCTHKILMEEDYKPVAQHQRRVNPKIHDVIKKEVEKLLDAGLIYSISDSPWVSPVHCVPKKGGFTVVENEENELIPTRLVTGWRVCIDYRKLNEVTRKDHFPLPFMDQMLERLAGNEYYCFLDGFFGYYQIPIDPRDQEKTTFTCPYGTFAYRRMPFGLCNAPGTFQRCMLAIFHDMVENTMEVFMDDFSVFRNSFENCLSCLDKMLQRCEDTKLCLNWEKSHFMVKEGIVLGHKISKNGIEFDKAKINVITKLPHPTTVKVYAFEKFRSYLIMNKCIVHTDHSALKYLFAKKDAKARLLRWVLLLQEFDFAVIYTKGAENLAATICPD